MPTADTSGAASLNLPSAQRPTASGAPADPARLGGVVAAAQAQVVRVANVVVDVTRGNVPATYDAVANLATANGGFVSDSSL